MISVTYEPLTLWDDVLKTDNDWGMQYFWHTKKSSFMYASAYVYYIKDHIIGFMNIRYS